MHSDEIKLLISDLVVSEPKDYTTEYLDLLATLQVVLTNFLKEDE